MAKLRYTIRLYRLHDLDLITFVETHEFNLIRAVYSSLSAFAKGDAFVIEIPPRRIQKLPPLNRVYIKALTLDSEQDKDAIEILAKIAPGYRNSFLKNLLRMYLCNPISEEFFRVTKKAKDSDEILYETPQSEIDEKSELFTNMFGIFKEGKRVAQAGKLQMRGRGKKKEKDEDKNKLETINTTPQNNKQIETSVEKKEEKREEEEKTNIQTETIIDIPLNDNKIVSIDEDTEQKPSVESQEAADEITDMFATII